ncbi:MAG: terpene cyclase/mutase family protein [Actinobacteria bacterium]|nr:terpene cyclase/mutase family protein [Actinomycetota bacterium]
MKFRVVGVVIACLLVATSAISPASAGPVRTASSDAGLFGSSDPTYDGVYRQSYALMGLMGAGADVPDSAIAWLVEQQCADGSFMGYRADTSVPCPPSDPATYTGPDTNSTALALAALTITGNGQDAELAAVAAQDWLRQQQTRGGGFPYFAGGAADTNSTGLAIAALGLIDGTKRVRQHASRYLRRTVYGCTAEPVQVGGLPYMAGSLPDALSTTQGLLGLADAFALVPRTQRKAAPKVICDSAGRPTDASSATARWIAAQITASRGWLPNAFAPGEADWNSTALGVIGLVATRTSGRATTLAVAALTENAEAYINDGTSDRPAALGTLTLAAIAASEDPRDFGGIDLPARLLATLQK